MVLTRGATQNVYLTLTEKEVLINPNYLFVFTNVSSNRTVSFVKLNATDTSLYKSRYNKFSFIVNTLFPAALLGQYNYNIYEQASAVNTDPTGLTLLETGLMELKETTVIFTNHTSVNTYTINNG